MNVPTMPPAKHLLPLGWEVPTQFRERLGDKVGRQRLMHAEGHLLLVLHKPPERDEVERRGRFFWRKPDGTWQASELGSGPGAIGRHLAEFAEIVDRFDRREDSAATAAEYFAILEAMTPLHRTVRNLHSVLQEARNQVEADRDLINLRDRAYELERTAELLCGDVRNALEFASAKQAEKLSAAQHEMAAAAHRLNSLAAFFFPLVTLCTIYGAGLGVELERMIPGYALYVMLGSGLVLGFVVASVFSAPPHKS